MPLNPELRLDAETYDIFIPVPGGRHEFSVQIARNRRGEVWEVCILNRGKIGHGLDDLFREFGIKLSRCIQRREPNPPEEA